MDGVKHAPLAKHTPGTRKTTCSSCRKRKSKCDGRQPECSTCITHRSQCHYDKLPSLAYVRSLEAKIEKLTQEASSSQSTSAETKEIIKTVEKQSTSSQHTGSPFESQPSSRPGDPINPFNQTLPTRGIDPNDDTDRWVSEISVNSHGGVCYHNPTSAMHEAPESDGHSKNGSFSVCSPEAVNSIVNELHQQTDVIKQALVSNAATQRRFEALAVQNMVQTDVSREMAADLLNLHWCWMHPMFMFVYRPAFTRDMTSRRETNYFSDTLLKVIFAHSSRFLIKSAINQDSANTLMKVLTDQAQMSLGMTIQKPSSIPTVQALLQQSAREVAFGRSSQAWLYSGMAFRMAIDLGIHLPSDKLQAYVKTLTDEDIEIRKRLFWSCYTWDKVISLYLGRMPGFNPPMELNTPDFMDDFTENYPWEPWYGPTARDPSRTTEVYPPSKGYVISCFTALSKLTIILSTIMLEIYGSSPVVDKANPESVGTSTSISPHTRLEANSTNNRSQNAKASAFYKISTEAQQWWNLLPEHLRLDVKYLPHLSPPPHIVSMNLLYHTTLILLHRPFIIGTTESNNPAVSRSYNICMRATAAIHDLLELLTRTFGHSHITYLNCYSAYIAATIAVLHFQRQEEPISVHLEPGIQENKLELKFFLGVLQRVAIGMPALSRSVEIVKKHMQIILEKRAENYMNSLFPTSRQSNIRASGGGYSNHMNTSAYGDMNPYNIYGGSENSTSSPNSMHTPINTSDHQYSGFNVEGLPAFPGQSLSMGMDYAFNAENLDPEARAALMGLNLDPHLTLNHNNGEWNNSGLYVNDVVSSPSNPY